MKDEELEERAAPPAAGDEDRRKDSDEEQPERPDMAEQIVRILHSDMRRSAKRDRLADYHSNDIAEALDALTRKERLDLYRLLGQDELS